ncbi:MAG: hypothetical protein ACJA05_000096 [Porticoccus sp.]|jgi:hypothetical protein
MDDGLEFKSYLNEPAALPVLQPLPKPYYL